MLKANHALAAGVGVLALASGSALAAAGDLVSVPDGDDTPVVLDIAQLDVQQNKDKRLQAKFIFSEAFKAQTLAANGGPPGSICLRVYIGTTPSSHSPQYLACAGPAGTHFRGSLYKDSTAGDALKRVGPVAVTHPNATTLILRFTPTAIGKPKTLRFAGEATQQVGCPQPRGCLDRVPNSVRTRSFTLAA
jgi:hypothetical protein